MHTRPPSLRNVTGLIYIVIIALWVAVLVPMWLRRHDQISELRSTAKFSRSMQRLELAERKARESAMAVHPSNQGKAVVVHNPDAHTEAARRRAVVLALLSSTLFVTLVLAMFSLLPIAAPITMLVLVVAFMGATAMTAPARARQAQQASTGRSARRRPVPAANVEPSRRVAAEADDFLEWDAWDDEDDAWEAVPTTLPTYVTAPKASPVPRPIDKVGAGAWTGEAMVDAARQMRRHETEHQVQQVDARDETAEIPVVRRAPIAVNQ